MTSNKPRFGRTYYYVFSVLALCLTIAGFVLLILNYSYFSNLRPHSYIGLFFISFLAGAPIPVFIPTAVLSFMLGSLLNPFLVGILSAAGSTLGNSLTYFAGRAGKYVFSSLYDSGSIPLPGVLERLLSRLRDSRVYNHGRRNQLLVLFIVACLPTPLLTPMVISLGACRVPAWKVLGITFTGQALLAVVMAWIGHLGLRTILDIFGIFNGS